MAHKPNVRRLVDDRDVHGLVQALRYPEDPEIRAQAAQALGKLGKVKPVESLIRSYLQDPDLDAREAALDALHQIIGGEADLAISAYTLPEDTWIEDKIESSQPLLAEMEEPVGSDEENPSDEDIEEEDEDDEDEDDLDEGEEQDPQAGGKEETIWSENDIQALLSVIRLDHSRRKRRKAIQALSQIPNTRAIDALASIALWSEEKWLRQAAHEALSGVYGDSLAEVLQSYREGSLDRLAGEGSDEGDDEGDESDDEEEGDEDDEGDNYDGEDEDEYDDDDEDDEGNEETVEDQENHNLPPHSADPVVSTVIHEEKPGWGTYLLFGLLILIILGGVVYLLTR